MSETLTSNTRVKQFADGQWYAETSDHPGVWATGDTKQEALVELPSVLRGWHESWHPSCPCCVETTIGTTEEQ